MTNTVYEDRFISFCLPEEYAAPVKHTHAHCWQMSSGRRLIEVGISTNRLRGGATADDEFEHFMKSFPGEDGISTVKEFSISGYKRAAYQSDIPQFKIRLLHEDGYLLFVTILTTKKTHQIEFFIPFLSSIKVLDFDEYYKYEGEEFEKLKNDPKNQIKYSADNPYKDMENDMGMALMWEILMKNLEIPMEMPEGFGFDEEHHEPGSCSICREGFRIQIFDHTGIGREADMEILDEQIKSEAADGTACHFPLPRKKCIVQSLDGKPLDIYNCRNIQVMISYRNKFFTLHMQSDQPFDLEKFSSFIDSIGRKRKK